MGLTEDRPYANGIRVGIVPHDDERAIAGLVHVKRPSAGGNVLDLDCGEGSICRRNIERTRDVLDELGIPIVRQDVGGTQGRSLTFEPKTGELSVHTVSGHAVT